MMLEFDDLICQSSGIYDDIAINMHKSGRFPPAETVKLVHRYAYSRPYHGCRRSRAAEKALVALQDQIVRKKRPFGITQGNHINSSFVSLQRTRRGECGASNQQVCNPQKL
jgi:hypothetical protein